MKKIKIIAAIAALFMVVAGAFAFTTTSTITALSDGWFRYDGSGPVDEPQNYEYLGATKPEDCGGFDNVCAIKAPVTTVNNQQRPVISSQLDQEIEDALNSHEPTENVLLRP